MNLKRKIEQEVFKIISWIAALICVGTLGWILLTIFIGAIPSITLDLFIYSEFGSPGRGIANAIAGTLLLAIISNLIAAPIGVSVAIFLQKYSKKGIFTNILNRTIDILAGTPSIVIGLFGLFFFAFALRSITGGFSLLSGSLALIFVVLPVIIRSVENAISSVPLVYEEGSYALGATKYQTLKKITLPTAIPGILTGLILGIGSAVEQSATVLLTAGYNQFFPEFGIYPPDREALMGVLLFDTQIRPLQQPIASLPIAIFNAFRDPIRIPRSDAFAIAFVLITIIIILNSIIRFVAWKKSKI